MPRVVHPWWKHLCDAQFIVMEVDTSVMIILVMSWNTSTTAQVWLSWFCHKFVMDVHAWQKTRPTVTNTYHHGSVFFCSEGRTKDGMQVLFHKHVWLYMTYIPTLHWWTGASSVSPYIITITWGIASDIIIHHWSNAYEIFTYCALLIYFSVATVTITTKLLSLLLSLLPLLPYYFATKYFAADIKLSRCGWIDNSTANTWEYSLAPLVSNQ